MVLDVQGFPVQQAFFLFNLGRVDMILPFGCEVVGVNKGSLG